VPVVRVGTCTFLTSAFSKTAYGRAHHGIEAFAAHHKYPVVSLRPNWFMDNLLAAAGEIKSAGQITYPTAGTGQPTNMIDPRDLASAAAHILKLPGDLLATFVAAQIIEVHGKESLNLADNVEALSKAVGYPIKINVVSFEDWVDTMVSRGRTLLPFSSFPSRNPPCPAPSPAPSPPTTRVSRHDGELRKKPAPFLLLSLPPPAVPRILANGHKMSVPRLGFCF
jgi:hypothetical protein